MLDSIKNKSLIHWFWSNCTFGYSIVALSIVYIVFVLFEIKNFYSILLFIFALNWFGVATYINYHCCLVVGSALGG